MVCYNLYIFNREGTCLFYQEWSRPKSVKQGAGTTSDDQKMMFGLFFSLKTFAAAMDPKMCASQPLDHYHCTRRYPVSMSCTSAVLKYASLRTLVAAATFPVLLHRSDDKPQLGAPLKIGQACTFKSFRTNNYKLHFMESPSGVKVYGVPLLNATMLCGTVSISFAHAMQIVFNTDQSVGNLADCLAYIYSNLYVEYVLKNPLYDPGQPFR